MASVLVVDDERSMRDFLSICLRRQGHEVVAAENGEEAFRRCENVDFDLVVTDLKMQGSIDGLQVLDHVKQRSPMTQVVMITAYATPETAIAAMKRGAYDYLTKPFKVDEIGVVVERALEKRKLVLDNEALRQELSGHYRLDRLVSKAPSMLRIFDIVRKVASTRTNVLLCGESGTGKELVARALHHEGSRASQPFVAVCCGAIPENLLESELFGHVCGAFTGAVSDKSGLFAVAHGGTLFLDEIGELSPNMQVKLLRALQERRIKPVGGVTEREIDVRVVAATNRDLEEEVARGAFRSDLYYRLNVIQLRLPPLRERREDIPLLALHFTHRYARLLERPVNSIAPEAMAALLDYDYAGNVRELENIIERAVTLEHTEQISREVLPDLAPRKRLPQADEAELPWDGVDLDQMVGELERGLLLKALRRAGGVRKEAARLLHITFRSLRYRLDKHGIAVDGDRPPEPDASPTPDGREQPPPQQPTQPQPMAGKQ